MKARIRRRHVPFALVALLGVGLIGWLLYALSPDVRLGVVGVLDRAGADGLLAALTADPDKDVRAAAGDALVRRGPPAVPALVRRLGGPGAEDRALTLAVLARMGPAAREAVPALKSRMWEDPDAGVRSLAADALVQVAGDDPDTAAEFVRLLADGDEAGRCRAAKALADRGGHTGVTVPALARALRDRSHLVRQEAAEALEHLGPKARLAVPALAEAVADPDPGVRKEAAEALEQVLAGLGPEDAALRDRARAALERAKADDRGPAGPVKHPGE